MSVFAAEKYLIECARAFVKCETTDAREALFSAALGYADAQELAAADMEVSKFPLDEVAEHDNVE